MTAAQIGDEVNILQERFNAPKAEVGKVIVGQDALLHRLLLGLLAEGHVLIEGVPGLAKTLAISTLADTLDVKFSRIQFTPDMLPGDITGTQIFNPKDGTYSVKRGPVFGNLVLADEINRAPAKVQAALLQAMQERQVTLGDETMDLEEPFLVLATQNPIEQEGTYPLPEAQLDRFMLKVIITYPSKEDEIKVLDRMAGAVAVPKASKVMSPAEILAAREVVRQIFVDDKVKRYVVELVSATRDPIAAGMTELENLIENGASVRASINLIKVAKANALLEGRSYISPHDVKSIANDVLRHRILVTYEAEAEGKSSDDVINIILDNVQVP
ncbi:MAG TPA: ATPase [Candidatus Latescibacteria bacterium]|jgi:MoxR-like ATPase|nr:ATPase [Candidatus Latescibacterota bacterium]|tara:strand:- start:843 stop:1829 length:987 start_codon:yes stop_codon:yes gene_type:complete